MLHVAVENVHVAWHGQFIGKERQGCVTPEDKADRTVCAWRTFFGISGSCSAMCVIEPTSPKNEPLQALSLCS